MNKCKYDVCWHGACNKDVIDNTEYCKEHLGVKCNSTKCNNQATGDCHGYNGSFVCGCPLCDEHKHKNH